MTFFNPEQNCYESFFFFSKPINEHHKNVLFTSFDSSLIKETPLYEKIILIADLFISEIKKKEIEQIGIESYSLHSVGMFTTIIENLGYLKVSLTKEQLSFLELSPTTIKKGFAGSGKATKEDMVRMFEEKINLDLYKILILNKSLKHIPKPITDIVDSFAISQEVYRRHDTV